MYVIRARNVHDMLPAALDFMSKFGVQEQSRNGPVLRLQEPCTLVYERPKERVLFHPERDANPFFHLLEACWMMTGRRDVAFPARYVKRMAAFSDDGMVFNAAYGYRWRNHFGLDQLFTIAETLKKNPECRRQVLAIWDGRHDLGLDSKDLPCNTQATFQIVNGALDMVVSNRSNDLVWGATGANAVHFSFLQEWMAIAIGVPVGRYWQVSSNLHLYINQHSKLLDTRLTASNYYAHSSLEPAPIMTIEPDRWVAELAMILEQGPSIIGLKDKFLRTVVRPAMVAYDAYKSGNFETAIRTAQLDVFDAFWSYEFVTWLHRRRQARIRANDDGVVYE